MTERLMGHCKSTSNRVAGREMHFGDSSLDAGREISGGEAGAVGLWSIDCSNSLCVDTATTASQGRIIIMLIVLALHSSLIIGAGFVVSTDTGEDCRVRISTKKRRVLRSCWCVSNQPWRDFAPVRALMRERVCTWKFGWRTLKLRRRGLQGSCLLTWPAKFVAGVEKVALRLDIVQARRRRIQGRERADRRGRDRRPGASTTGPRRCSRRRGRAAITTRS